MHRLPRRVVAALAFLIVGSQFVRPAKTNPASDPARALSAMHPMPAHVAAVIDHACRDCHSNGTRWPWYSNVAPVSWFVINHVNHGRSHFNYSDWSRYEPAEAARLLKEACRLARERAMPLRSYTWIHRSARLTPRDVDALCAWTGANPDR
ncbi:MAG TPA: heme-binding domain-containing protein [Vicinamibacterales bacterium]|nr:heme-binding domain-containing protein [Vicinamibacterales bacterium]